MCVWSGCFSLSGLPETPLPPSSPFQGRLQLGSQPPPLAGTGHHSRGPGLVQPPRSAAFPRRSSRLSLSGRPPGPGLATPAMHASPAAPPRPASGAAQAARAGFLVKRRERKSRARPRTCAPRRAAGLPCRARPGACAPRCRCSMLSSASCSPPSGARSGSRSEPCQVTAPHGSGDLLSRGRAGCDPAAGAGPGVPRLVPSPPCANLSSPRVPAGPSARAGYSPRKQEGSGCSCLPP